MPKVNGVNLSLLLKNKKVSTETQIYYLKKVGEILNKLKYIRETTDLYCYIIMILNYLYGESINNVDIVRFYDYLNYLESIGVNKELIENFGKILINKDNENPIELLDSITNEQVYRAKKNVYEKLGK